jgi:hypothetical protein
VGDNTSQQNDGNAGGQKFVVASGQRALVRSSYQDTHFTVLGFTNALGEAVCCAIILCGQEVEAKNVMGFRPWAEKIGNPEIDMEANSHGLDKVYPFGPTCHFQGKEIPTYVTASENGSITDKILTDIMKHLDTYLTFDRTEATPFLLLDGHGSRFGLPFLEYIRDESHKWTVCIGVPYGTNLWQVGDSSQQNGAFKIALKKAKQCLLQHKEMFPPIPVRIEKHDIVGLVHEAWNQSFAQVESNKRAIAERGWSPLTYTLLDHPELTRKKDTTAIQQAYKRSSLSGINICNASTLNLDNGIAGTIMESIIERKIRERTRNQAIVEQRQKIMQQNKELFEKCMRLTAGVAFRAGEVDLSNGTILEKVREQNRRRNEKELAITNKRKAAEDELKRKVNIIRNGNTDPTKWKLTDLKVMVSYFKRPGDSKMPTTRNKLLTRYILTCSRIETERGRLKEGEEPVVDDDDGAGVTTPNTGHGTIEQSHDNDNEIE